MRGAAQQRTGPPRPATMTDSCVPETIDIEGVRPKAYPSAGRNPNTETVSVLVLGFYVDATLTSHLFRPARPMALPCVACQMRAALTLRSPNENTQMIDSYMRNTYKNQENIGLFIRGRHAAGG